MHVCIKPRLVMTFNIRDFFLDEKLKNVMHDYIIYLPTTKSK